MIVKVPWYILKEFKTVHQNEIWFVRINSNTYSWEDAYTGRSIEYDINTGMHIYPIFHQWLTSMANKPLTKLLNGE